jgi:hypothetical protein
MGVPQQEGYGYFGAGLLALAVIVIPFALRRIRFNRTLAAQVGPLLAVSGLFTLFALSTKITAGSSVLVDLDPQGTVSALFNPLRASGRFFWVAYYAVFVGAIAACFRLWRAWVAVAIVAAALVVQFADGARERRWMHRVVSTEHSSPFHSPFWATAGKRYRHLVVLPAGQCGLETPDGAEGFRDFGLLAVAQRMTINSYSAGRYSEASIDYQCDRAVLQAVSRPLDPESLYVVTPPIAEQIERGAGHCRTVDGFFVCSAETRDH